MLILRNQVRILILYVYSADITHVVLQSFSSCDHNALDCICSFLSRVDQVLQQKIHEMVAEELEDAVGIASLCVSANTVQQMTSAGSPHTHIPVQVWPI